MTEDTLRTLLQDALERLDPPISAEVHVEPDLLNGFRVIVTSSDFYGRLLPDRRSLVASVFDDREDVSQLRLLDPDEVAEYGNFDQQEARTNWAAALAAAKREHIRVRLPSATFEILKPPIVATFYSLRGGVGRSTALAHSALLLAEQGLKVLAVDMDLEAPGLASLFGVEDRVADRQGVVELLAQIDASESVPDLEPHILRVSEDVDLSLLPAGRPSANYAAGLAGIDPDAWYRESFNPLRELMSAIRVMDLAVRPDVVLVDSRTGISPVAAPLLFDLSDIAIVAFYPHPQAKEGTGLLTRAILAAETERSRREGIERLTPELRFVVSPVPATPESFELASSRAQNWISEWLSPARTESGEVAFPAVEDILHVIQYEEATATNDVIDHAVAGSSPYEAISGWIGGFASRGEDFSPVESFGRVGPQKLDVLQSLDFVGETAESQPLDTLRNVFVGTAAVSAALNPATPLVIGRKGTGKTFLFRHLAADEKATPITVAPGVRDELKPWTPNSEFYNSLRGNVGESGSGWSRAWMAVIGSILLREGLARSAPEIELRAAEDGPYVVSTLLSDVRKLLGMADAGLVLREWLIAIDDTLEDERLILFDGLDTGFGDDRSLRDLAVSGLLLLANELGADLKRLRFKVLLREDIWRAVTIPNKSHLRSRAAVLAWNDQVDYLRIAIRQAWRSEEFRTVAIPRLQEDRFAGTVPFRFETEIEFWPESYIRKAWQVLVGERVAGGKTAFTDNWVWSRLADGNGDHAPRHLVELLKESVTREMVLERGAPFARSVVRPRALVESLDSVSVRALDALRNEEFGELEPIFQALERIGETPFQADQLSFEDPDLLALAEEVGLVDVSTTTRDDTRRYRVPEIYRKALNMSRRGQQ